MDKQLIERIALEVAEKVGAVAMCKDPIAFTKLVIERIDAERGNEAVGMVVDAFDGWTKVRMFKNQPSGTRLFLSAPTIPEGMALVPIEPTEAMLIEGRQADTDWMNSDDPEEEFEQGLAYIYKAMIAAAQGERNAD